MAGKEERAQPPCAQLLLQLGQRVHGEPVVLLHRADVVGVLMGDEDMSDALRRDAEPRHLFGQPVVVIAGVHHDSRAVLAVKEDVRHPLAHAGDVPVDPARVRGLENLRAAVHAAHGTF